MLIFAGVPLGTVLDEARCGHAWQLHYIQLFSWASSAVSGGCMCPGVQECV